MCTRFNTIVGWGLKEDKIIEQYKRFCKKEKGEISNVGTCLRIIPQIIMNSGCPEVDFSLVREEDRKTTGVFILTIYNDPKKLTEEEIRNILNSFPPIFETIKRDLGIIGSPKMYLKEP